MNDINKIVKQLLLWINEIKKLNIIHTDIKSQNVLINCKNSLYDEIIKLFKNDIDFDEIYKKFIITIFFPNLQTEFEHFKNDNKLNDFYNKLFLENKHVTETKKFIYENKKMCIHILNLLEQKSSFNLNLFENNCFKFDKIENFNYNSDIESDVLSCDWDKTNYNVTMTNFKIKLIDYNLAINKNEKFKIDENYEYQTRFYRAPEVILKYDIQSWWDLWWLGCLIYELITGNLLFDVYDEKFSEEKNYNSLHLFLIIHHFGWEKILSDMDVKKKFSNNFHNLKNIELNNFQNILKQKIYSDIYSNDVSFKNKFYDVYLNLLQNLFIVDPNKRSEIDLLNLYSDLCFE